LALTSTGNDQREFIVRDVAEIVIGSCVLAFPIAVTEEVWRLSETLPLGRAMYLAVWSVIFIAIFTYHHYFQGQGAWRDHFGRFALRVLGSYVITLITVATMLLALNQLLAVDHAVALKRTVIVSFPASFAATIVDGMSKD
jgi:uncharacterized membrane protein